MLFQRELREQQQLLLQQQQQQSQLQLQSQASESSGSGNSGRGSNSLQLKWADRKPVLVNKVKSLAEIQAEEQEQLAKV
jgi:PERQ amino acid-rich with GYF domain-containing protein